jgi:hypothetical protein
MRSDNAATPKAELLFPPLENSAVTPTPVLRDPLLLLKRAFPPIAVLSCPVVELYRLPVPIAVFEPPEVFARSAELPTATLKLPLVLFIKAELPNAEFQMPDVLERRADAPAAVLFASLPLPLPKVTPFMTASAVLFSACVFIALPTVRLFLIIKPPLPAGVVSAIVVPIPTSPEERIVIFATLFVSNLRWYASLVPIVILAERVFPPATTVKDDVVDTSVYVFCQFVLKAQTDEYTLFQLALVAHTDEYTLFQLALVAHTVEYTLFQLALVAHTVEYTLFQLALLGETAV